MNHLLIGGGGLVGRAVRDELTEREVDLTWTSRRCLPGSVKFDLLDDPSSLPQAHIVYIVAGVPSFAACEVGRVPWLVNVDGAINVATRFRESLVVYVSSDCVEWAGNTALARQKAAAEAYMRTLAYSAIIRPSKITKDTVGRFAKFMVHTALSVATGGKSGVFRWGEVR